MGSINLSDQEKQLIVEKLQKYFNDELDQDLGRFDAEFLLDFISTDLGAYFYNRGLLDAQAVLQDRLENINDAIYEIQKPTDLQR